MSDQDDHSHHHYNHDGHEGHFIPAIAPVQSEVHNSTSSPLLQDDGSLNEFTNSLEGDVDHSLHVGVTDAPPNAPHHSHSNAGSSTSHDHSMMGMSMAFHFGYAETILFSFWKINGITGLIGSMIGIFLISMLYEGLKVLREYLLQRSLQREGVAMNGDRGVASSSAASSNNGLRVPLAGEGDSIIPDNSLAVKAFRPNPSPCSVSHFVQTALHMIQMVISYLLMLIFMTYNVWLCLAVVLGAGCGYYVFGWRKRTIIDINEHCH